MRTTYLAAALPLVVAGAALSLQWLPSPASPTALAQAEAALLANVRAPVVFNTVEAGGHTIHSATIGEAGKPPLVLLHGHGGGLAMYYRNFDALAEDFTIHALDLPGWGRSSRPRVDRSTPEAARDWWVDALEAWRGEAGLDRFSLLGHSLGGFIAASYSLAYPEQVEHLYLVDAAGISAPVVWTDGVYFHLTPQRIVRLAGPYGPGLVASSRSDQAHLPASDQLNDYFYQLSAAEPSGERLFLSLIGLNRWHLPLVDRLAAITAPTTIVWGADDVLTHPRNAALAHERIAGSELIVIPGAGHIPFLEQPDAFHRAVLDRARAVRSQAGEPSPNLSVYEPPIGSRIHPGLTP